MSDSDKLLPHSPTDAIPLANQIGQAIRAGLPLESGLRALAEQTRSRHSRLALLELSQNLEQGMPLADALRASKSGLPQSMTALIVAGVESGRLDSVMRCCIEQVQRTTSLRQHIWLALSYPLFLMWFSTLICGGILLLIVPSFKQIFDDFGTEIPTLTLALVTVSSFLTSWGLVPWMVLLGGGFVSWLLFISAGLSRWSQRWTTSIPVMGRPFQYAALTDFCEILAILAESGLAFPKALTFAGGASDDRWLRKQCHFMAHDIELGATPSNAARLAHMPNTLSQVFRDVNSERTFAQALRGLADIYAAQCNITAQFANTGVSHAAVTFVISFAGVTALAMMLPLIRLLNDLS